MNKETAPRGTQVQHYILVEHEMSMINALAAGRSMKRDTTEQFSSVAETYYAPILDMIFTRESAQDAIASGMIKSS